MFAFNMGFEIWLIKYMYQLLYISFTRTSLNCTFLKISHSHNILMYYYFILLLSQ